MRWLWLWSVGGSYHVNDAKTERDAERTVAYQKSEWGAICGPLIRVVLPLPRKPAAKRGK